MTLATPAELLRQRLENQGLARAGFQKAEDVVAWFGAVQAQDYLGALWALGLRTRRATESSVENAEARRAIVRLWPMRGTLHFVAAADARWITQLLAPRVIARNAARLKREFGVDAAVVARARDAVRRALSGGRRLERTELYQALESRRIRTGDSRGQHILGWLAMEGTLCLAGRSGKQHTFALLDEWIPDSTRFDREAALAELATRYFTSHGPATLKDFMWWAGITARDAQIAIDAARDRLVSAVIRERPYWWREPRRAARRQRGPHVRLLPAFDEYTVAYHDRSLLCGDRAASKMSLLGPAVLVDGHVTGTWKRRLEKQMVIIETSLSRPLTRAESAALQEAKRQLASFLGRDLRLP
jgi:hypothetical protein